jgi:CBS domain-containing protein
VYEFLDYQVMDVMSQPICLAAGSTLAEAETLLEKHGINALPVVDADGKLLGLVSSLDLLRAFDFSEDTILPAFGEVMKRPVETVMTRDVITVCPRTPLTRVLAKIVDTRNKSFPVVDDGRVVGMVAREDVMLALRRGVAGVKPPTG